MADRNGRGVTFSSLQGGGGSAPAPSATGGAFPTDLSVAQFQADYGITSTEMGMFETGGKLNTNAEAFMQYHDLTQAERQSIQQAMAQAGMLPPSAATGELNSTTTGAFRSLLGSASATGQSVTSYLAQIGQGGLGPIENQVAGNLASAQKVLGSTTPVVATETNPTTAMAQLQSAFAQTLGYAPSQDQLNQFVSEIQGQDVAFAQSGNEANRAAAQADIARAHSEQSALNKLGPDGIDAFLSAYANAIHGTGAAGAGTSRGPATGAVPNAGSRFLTPGSRLPADTNVGFIPGGAEMLSNPMPNVSTTTQQVPNTLGLGAGLLHGLSVVGQPSGGTHPVTTTRVTPGKSTTFAPPIPVGDQGTTPTYGGLYALTPKLWQEAQKLTPSAKKYASAGQAPASIQQSAVTNLATDLYSQYLSWSDVATVLAGGTPEKNGSVLGTGTHLDTFAQGVAAQVNRQIESLQNEANTTPTVTIKTAQPDVAAEANQAAKQADPVGYYAANYASWGGLLGKMLYGRPLDLIQSTADTFTGPVGATAAPSAPAGATASATAAA